MTPFNRKMNVNSIYAGLTNLVQFFKLFDFDITGNEIVDKVRVDGTLLGDTKIYRSFDVDGTYPFVQTGASNLLAEAWVTNISEQSITLDQQRQTVIMTAELMEKQAWDTEGSFSTFTTLLLDIINKNKKLFEVGYVLTFLATMTPTATITVDMSDLVEPKTAVELEAFNRIYSQRAATAISDFFYEARDNRRDLNGYGYIRSYDMNKASLVWNYKEVNKLKFDTSNMFHRDGVLDKFLKGTVVTDNYISKPSNIISADVTVAEANKYVSLVEVNSDGTDKLPVAKGEYRIYPGNFLPVGFEAKKGEAYTVDTDAVGYIFFPEALPFMTGYVRNTNFTDASKLRSKDFLTWGYNTLEYLNEFPFVKVVKVGPSPADI